MKKLRVFQTVKIKRIVPGFFPRNLGTVLLFLLLIPYLVTFLLGNVREGEGAAGLDKMDDGAEEGHIFVNNSTACGKERIPLENYVADRLARGISGEMEMEALKAQAVLIRSQVLSSLKGRYGGEIETQDAGYGSVPIPEKVFAATAQTAGVCVMYENQPISGAYFAVSNGATRNAQELLLTGYPYLKSVECGRDFLAQDYASYACYEEKEFQRLWQQAPSFSITGKEIMEKEGVTAEEGPDAFTLYRDSVDYVLYIEQGGKFVAGEQFAESFHIASSSFHLNKEENQIYIMVKGVGHGLGMSLFGANEMAKEGEDYIKILNYFFQDVIITKFE